MYWTHLIFALALFLCFNWWTVAIKAGYLDFDNLPETNFSCEGKVIGGYYADVETGCQMFHVCTIGQKGEVTDIKFLCLNGTVFDQETRVCERIDEVDCSKSEDFFNLNLELYGNHAGGIQPEEEFECEDCSTEGDEYDSSKETTTSTPTTTSTTTTTTTTTVKPTTTTIRATTAKAASLYHHHHHHTSSNPDTIAALLALHNAFTQSLGKVKPAPPRVINNAFAPTPVPPPVKATLKPSGSFYSSLSPQRPTLSVNLKAHYNAPIEGPSESGEEIHEELGDSQQDYGSLNTSQEPIPQYYQLTTAHPKSNYHHFQSGDTSFGHSLDSNKPYNFQYFHSRRSSDQQISPNDSLSKKASVSIVTSTSTSTSVRTAPSLLTAPSEDASKENTSDGNSTAPESVSRGHTIDFPTGYEDDYGVLIEADQYFRDIHKIRSKRSEKRHPNHRYPDTDVGAKRHRNHRYDTDFQTASFPSPALPTKPDLLSKDPEDPSGHNREEFLQNLLGSLDMDDNEREKMVKFFTAGNQDKAESSGGLKSLGDKLSFLIMNDVNKTIQEANKQNSNNASNKMWDLEQISNVWRRNYEEMSKEVDLNFHVDERHRRDINAWKSKFDENTTDVEYIDTDTGESFLSPEEVKLSANRRADSGSSVDSTRFISSGKSGERRRGRIDIRRLKARPSSTSRPVTKSLNGGRSRDIVPVFEEIEGDLTTVPYRGTTPRIPLPSVIARNSKRLRNEQPRSSNKNPIHKPHAPIASHELKSNVTRDPKKLKQVPVYEDVDITAEGTSIELEEIPRPPPPSRRVTSRRRLTTSTSSPSTAPQQAQFDVPNPRGSTSPRRPHQLQSRGRTRSTTTEPTTTSSTGPPALPEYILENRQPDPDFKCEGKVKGGFYADVKSDCRGFFICSQGQINGPLLKSHFWCGAATRFNQRSRTCQAEDLVACSISEKYFHLNNDFLVPELEEELRPKFEAKKVSA